MHWRKNSPWLLIPPALAVALVIGPRSPLTEAEPAPAAAADPYDPSLWFALAATGAALLFVGILLRRRPAPAPRTSPTSGALRLDDSLSLSKTARIHAVQFGARLLIVGECRGRLSVLAEDEASAAAEDHSGAEPIDLVIPRRDARAAPAAQRPRTASRSPKTAELTDLAKLLDLAGVDATS